MTSLLVLALAGCGLAFDFDGYHAPGPTGGPTGGGPGGSTGGGASGSMMRVPPGTFMMGCQTSNDPDCASDETPMHPVTLSAYEIDETEVTQQDYRACLDASVCAAPTCGFDPRNQPTSPVVCVTWEQARVYCVWAGKRLPTEAEWEKAARSTDGRMYPWGPAPPDCMRANFGTCAGGTQPVGSHPSGASPYGALDMSGNVWEWVADWYAAGYYAMSPLTDPTGPAQGTSRIRRGGDFSKTADDLRAAHRKADTPNAPDTDLGFRCAR